MANPRNILNEIKWKKNHNFDDVEIIIIHRGAPNNTKKLLGNQITKIGRSFVYTNHSMIPLHRIIKISLGDKNYFKRKQ